MTELINSMQSHLNGDGDESGDTESAITIKDMSLSELAQRANTAAAETEECMSATVEAAIRCGEALIAAKANVAHGEWLSWLEHNFTRRRETARKYMKVANSHRDGNLNEADSIRDVLRRISGPKKGSAEDRDDTIAEKLLDGATQQEICREFHVQNDHVQGIYYNAVVPDLLQVDWRSFVSKSLVKEMEIAKHLSVIEAEYRSKELTGGVAAFAAQEANASMDKISAANRIRKHGCHLLISRCEEGSVALTTARDISRKDHDAQMNDLKTIDRSRVVSLFDDLRSRIGLMSDQKLGWVREHGHDEQIFVKLRDKAESAEIAELVTHLKSVSEWSKTVARLLEEGNVYDGRQD